MNKVILLFIVITLTTISLTGCWNYVEVDKLSLVSGMAIDKKTSGNGFDITAEIIEANSSDKKATFDSLLIQSSGESIFDSIRNMINISAKKLYWSHATIVIISKDVAKDGIFPILDWVTRDSEPRLTTYLLISETDKAKDILNLESLSTKIRSYEIESMIISNKRLSKIPNIKLYELVNEISTEGIYPVIPTVNEIFNEGKKTMALSGGAIFNKDTLAGFIGLEDVKNYLFVRNQINGGLLPIVLDINDTKINTTLEIFHNKTKVTPILSKGDVSMNIKIKTEVSIAELDADIDIMNELNVEKIKVAAEKSLENNILQLIKKIKEDFGLDIFGFGNKVREKMPDLWKNIGSNWDEIFKELKVDVDVDIRVRGSGHTSDTIKYIK